MRAVRFRRRRKAAPLPSHGADVQGYEFMGILGQGGFAKVYAVRRDRAPADSITALKVIPLERFLTATGMTAHQTVLHVTDIKRFCCEGQHDNIIRMLDFRIGPENIYLDLELCEGADLFDRVTKSPMGHLSESDTKDVARSLCSAVDFIHTRGILHRDIKPENCFFRRRDSPMSDVVLADFDCALVTAQPTAWFRGSAGSSGYVSPEMSSGHAWNHLTDVWSLGTTLYECFTGRSPCIETDDDGIRYQLIYDYGVPFPPLYWTKHSAEAQRFIRTLLEVDVNRRTTAGEALGHPWLNDWASLSPTLPDLSKRESAGSGSTTGSSSSGSSADIICVTPPDLVAHNIDPPVYAPLNAVDCLNAVPRDVPKSVSTSEASLAVPSIYQLATLRVVDA